jgi:beta-glucosidase
VVAVFLSGRPLWVNAELNASDAFVAAFLPGTEGSGVADMLFRKRDGSIAEDFRGRLSFSWPKRPDQFVLNRRDPGYDPLFPIGFGLTYAAPTHLARLDETRPAGLDDGNNTRFWSRGRLPDGWHLSIGDRDSARAVLPGAVGATPTRRLAVTAVDRRAQEDSRRLAFTGDAEMRIEASRPVDVTRETNGELSLVVEYRIDQPLTGNVTLAMGAGGRTRAVTVRRMLARTAPGAWGTIAVPLQCFRAGGLDMARVDMPFALSATGGVAISISDVRLDYVATPMSRCGDE